MTIQLPNYQKHQLIPDVTMETVGVRNIMGKQQEEDEEQDRNSKLMKERVSSPFMESLDFLFP